MRSFIIFLILLLHITTGHDSDVYGAQNCGISQVGSAHFGAARRRRSSPVDAHSNDANFDGGVQQQELDENAILNEDDNDFMQEKVMGGRRAERGELPWAVHLRTRISVCGGTLVSRRHIISASHCFKRTRKRPCGTSIMSSMEEVINGTKVFIGGTCTKANRSGCIDSDVGRIYKVARAFYDGWFKKDCKGTHDIAILELTEDVPKTINHVCLPFINHLQEIEDPYLKMRTFGWGRDPIKHAKLSPYLQIADLGAKSTGEECDKVTVWKAKDTFCFTSISPTWCPGDSGGGVTAKIHGRSYLMGIVSQGGNCQHNVDYLKKRRKKRPYPMVATDIMYHRKLIEKWLQTEKSENQPAETHKISLPNVLNTLFNMFNRLLRFLFPSSQKKAP
ncbi:unnamed protein product [Cylicocyclus nassatus]|uniref:Peptidase S1 domain-containing protein n=1 Tax=Cylicocyclus nassatus TaxID=53992 RepID=A0AA36GWU6_CYLNA|nr:unnamed protein product [Cylicocyclus nassatus]